MPISADYTSLMTLPHSPQRILIVGAGGFGREVYHWARAAWPEWHDRLAGFLGKSAQTPIPTSRSVSPTPTMRGGPLEPSADRSARTRIPSVGDTGLLILADPADYAPQSGDAFLLAIGIPDVRRRVAKALASRGAEFLTLVHPTAVVAPTATLGAGSIVCPHAVVSDAAVTGRCVLVNYHASLAHDAAAGDYVVLSPYATLAGEARVGADAFLGLHASVGPGVVVGERSKVAANSCTLNDVPPDSLVYGVPGRVTPLLT
jgi:sugar O-acyltransferase (sialic acid O-acetyltransferase NeuD family)